MELIGILLEGLASSFGVVLHLLWPLRWILLIMLILIVGAFILGLLVPNKKSKSKK